MKISVRPAAECEIDAVEQLYNDLNDYLAVPEHGKHGPRWIKGVYPIREDAQEAFAAHTLYVAEADGQIAGTVILDDGQGEVYRDVDWLLPYDIPVLIVHKLAVHPHYLKCGVGAALLQYAEELARRQGKEAVRLDTYIDNIPAARLYEKCGYSCRGLVDLGLGELYGLKWYKAYEKIVQK